MTGLVGYLVLFTGLAVFFLFIHLVIGRFVRPVRPDPDKLTIYECGEPTIGSAWIQFDLRFYVVALLFVIFDVEVAFFFPWAVVFGKTNNLAHTPVPQTDKELAAFKEQGWPAYKKQVSELVPTKYPENQERLARYDPDRETNPPPAKELQRNQEAAHAVAWFAFWDILVFFGVLLVGFAYLWRRGDLDWVRSTAAEKAAQAKVPPERADIDLLVGAGRGS
jgi:NADH-quinone oxidoreductase subunit A